MPKRVQFASHIQHVGDEDGDSPSGNKKVRFNDEELQKLGRFKDKHSLDSDEEDENEDRKYGVMDAEEIEGCEDSTIEYDEGIKITPFNMNEEMEEGHFDAQGNYVWKKEDNIQDAWMDNIDWVKVKEGVGVKLGKSYNVSDMIGDSSDDDEGDDVLISPAAKIEQYRKMIALMKPGESVLKAIRRLGGGSKSSASSRWKNKRQQQKSSSEPEAGAESGSDRAGMLELTGVADRFLQRGDMEIYECTFERISHLITRHDAARATGPVGGQGGGDVLDMFAEEPSGALQKPASPLRTGSVEVGCSSAETEVQTVVEEEAGLGVSEEVMWEYKASDSDPDLRGPYTSRQMLEWSDEGKFSTPVLVRKCTTSTSTSADFYSSARIDFELYT